MKTPTILPCLLLSLLLSSCSSYLTSSENVSNTKNDYEKILVIGRSKDNTARIKFENSVVSQLAEQCLNGISAYAANAMVN